MTQTKFTPGPWQISWSTFSGWESHGVYAAGEMDLKGFQIAIVNYHPTLSKSASEETGKANVRLIAAAPEMYELLQFLVETEATNVDERRKINAILNKINQ